MRLEPDASKEGLVQMHMVAQSHATQNRKTAPSKSLMTARAQGRGEEEEEANAVSEVEEELYYCRAKQRR
jgi:hypothetical protein